LFVEKALRRVTIDRLCLSPKTPFEAVEELCPFLRFLPKRFSRRRFDFMLAVVEQSALLICRLQESVLGLAKVHELALAVFLKQLRLLPSA